MMLMVYMMAEALQIFSGFRFGDVRQSYRFKGSVAFAQSTHSGSISAVTHMSLWCCQVGSLATIASVLQKTSHFTHGHMHVLKRDANRRIIVATGRAAKNTSVASSSTFGSEVR